MSRLFALDSTIIIILAGGDSPELRAKERAEGILLEHEDAGETVGVPAAAWAECCHCEIDTTTSFVIWPLNAAAAVLANRLTPPMVSLAKANGSTRRAAKIDALILATAEIVGCTALYTTDGWFGDIAKKEGLRVQIRDLPAIRPFQVLMPEVPLIQHDTAKKPKKS